MISKACVWFEDEEESPDRRVNVISSEDLMRRYLEDVSNHEGEVETLFEDHEPLEEKRNLETGTMDQVREFA